MRILKLTVSLIVLCGVWSIGYAQQLPRQIERAAEVFLAPADIVARAARLQSGMILRDRSTTAQYELAPAAFQALARRIVDFVESGNPTDRIPLIEEYQSPFVLGLEIIMHFLELGVEIDREYLHAHRLFMNAISRPDGDLQLSGSALKRALELWKGYLETNDLEVAWMEFKQWLRMSAGDIVPALQLQNSQLGPVALFRLLDIGYQQSPNDVTDFMNRQPVARLAAGVVTESAKLLTPERLADSPEFIGEINLFTALRLLNRAAAVYPNELEPAKQARLTLVKSDQPMPTSLWQVPLVNLTDLRRARIAEQIIAIHGATEDALNLGDYELAQEITESLTCFAVDHPTLLLAQFVGRLPKAYLEFATEGAYDYDLKVRNRAMNRAKALLLWGFPGLQLREDLNLERAFQSALLLHRAAVGLYGEAPVPAEYACRLLRQLGEEGVLTRWFEVANKNEVAQREFAILVEIADPSSETPPSPKAFDSARLENLKLILATLARTALNQSQLHRSLSALVAAHLQALAESCRAVKKGAERDGAAGFYDRVDQVARGRGSLLDFNSGMLITLSGGFDRVPLLPDDLLKPNRVAEAVYDLQRLIPYPLTTELMTTIRTIELLPIELR